MEPENNIKVILPVLINIKDIKATSQLLIFKEPEKADEKKREAPQMAIDGLAEWKRLKDA